MKSEFFAKAKGNASQMEDTWMANEHYTAVFDGATAKAAFRFSDGRTPGQVAAQTLARTMAMLPPELDAFQAVQRLSAALRQDLDGHRGEASGVIYSHFRHEIWMVGDCQFALLHQDGSFEQHHTEKAIDHILSHWRADILHSYLSRGLMTPQQIQADDPGRRIIQPFITRQVLYQNLDPNGNPAPLRDNGSCAGIDLAFGVFDGTPIPEQFIEVYPIAEDTEEIILASDGYPRLFPTLEETERHLHQLLIEDPLCIGPLCGTKGIKPGNEAHDDRTYLKVKKTLSAHRGAPPP